MTIPQGFLYDQNSGLYYKETATTDQSGVPVRRILWFDPNTGATTEHFYPMPDHPVTAIPITPQSEPVAQPIVEPIQQTTAPPVNPQTPPKKKGKGCLIAALIGGGALLLGGIVTVIVVVLILVSGNSGMGEELWSFFAITDVVESAPSSDNLNLDDLSVTIQPYPDDSGDFTVRINGFHTSPMAQDFTSLVENAVSRELLYDFSIIVDDQSRLALTLSGGSAYIPVSGQYQMEAAFWLHDSANGGYDHLIDLEVYSTADSFWFSVPDPQSRFLKEDVSYRIEVTEGDRYAEHTLTPNEDLFFLDYAATE